MNDMTLSDFAATMIVTGTLLFAVLAAYLIMDVCCAIAAKQKPRRIDPLIVAWPAIPPCQPIEETPQHIIEAEYVAARAWDIWEMSPRAGGGCDD